MLMLEQSDAATRLPARDWNWARKFYSEKLGLEPFGGAAGKLSLPERQRFLCLIRIHGRGLGHSHSNGLGGCRYRGGRDRAQRAWSCLRRIRSARPENRKWNRRNRGELPQQGSR